MFERLANERQFGSQIGDYRFRGPFDRRAFSRFRGTETAAHEASHIDGLVGALKKTALGPVTYEKSKCIGCRYCLVACPFSVPRYEWTKLAPYVKKCDMCAARQASGQPPACVEACPTQASMVGWRDEILEEAQRRVLNDEKYVKHIYGSEEAGGTSVFFISDVPFEHLGFVAAPRQPMPALSAAALGDVPTVVLVGGSLLAGIYWISERRNEVALVEGRERKEKV